MNVLSLFNGYSAAYVAMERVGLKVNNYYSSEIDKYADIISHKNFKDIIDLGDVRDFDKWDLPEIDILFAGSPCQDLSRVKSKERTGLKGDKSSLFYSFYGALQLHKPKYFLLENVVMPKEDEDVITRLLGVEPVLIDSGKFSAQNRDRLYWTNIDFDKNLPNSNLVIKDIMQKEVEEKYYYKDREFELHSPNKRVIGNLNTHTKEGKRHFTELTSRIYNIDHKCATLTAVSGGHQEKKIYDGKGIRKLTPLEYERLQTLPDGYTEGVSNSQRYKMLGNGWTADVIAHILKGIKEVE